MNVIVKTIANEARRRLDNGWRLGFARDGQDQAAHPPVPEWRWYHRWALKKEINQ